MAWVNANTEIIIIIIGIHPGKWDAQNSLGFWDTNGSLNRCQTTRPSGSKKKPSRIVNFAVLANHRVKLKESEKRNKYLDLARELKKTMRLESDGDTNCNWRARYSHQNWFRDWRTWKWEEEWRPSKLQHYWDRLEYWEESWRLEESCCHSNSSGKPSANAGLKNSQELNNIFILKGIIMDFFFVRHS